MAQSKFDIFKFDDAREKEEIRPGSKFNLFKFEDKKPKNEFKTSPNSDEKLQLKNLDLRNTLDDKPTKFDIFKFDDIQQSKPHSDLKTEFDLGDAFYLGLTDTLRGTKQLAGSETFFGANMKAQQDRLNKALQGEGGGLIAAAYFGGAILDPLTWLIPVTRAKTLYQMAKTGFIAGGLAGAFGYVDDQSPFDTRLKQAGAGAIGGAIFSPAIGKALELAKAKKITKSIERDATKLTDEDIAKLPADQRKKIFLAGKEDIIKKKIGKDKRPLEKIKGAGERYEDVRLSIPKFKVEIINGIPRVFSQDSSKATNKNFILRGPREFFKSILGSYTEAAQKVTKPIVEPVEAAKTAYTKAANRVYGNLTKPGGLGPNVGTGLAGGLYGFSMPEEEGNITTKFSRAAVGFMMGMGGVAVGRRIKAPKTLAKGDEDLSMTGYLAKMFVDGYKVPSKVKDLETLNLSGFKNKIEIQFLKIYQEANQLTTGERKVLYNILEGDIKANVAPKDLANIAKKARNQITKITQMYIDAGLITEETALRNLQRYLKRTYGGQPIAAIGSELKARGILEDITPKEWVERYSKIKAFKIDDTGKRSKLEGHKGWELFGNVRKVDTFEEAEKATPALMRKYAKDPKLANKPIVTARWEYTKQERLGMGEIEDGAFAILETGRLMSETLPLYKFYADLAQQPFVRSQPTALQIKNENLVKVPVGVRQGTIQQRYGKLAGKHVPQEIFENITQIDKIRQGPDKPFFKAYRKLNQFWKASKTAWNPTVHVNNIISNLVLLDLVDGSYKYLPGAVKAFVDKSKGKSVKMLDEAGEMGVFGSGYVARELDALDPSKINPSIYQVSKDKTVAENATLISKGFFEDVILKNKLGAQKLSDWYGTEDSIFRLALYIDRREKGFSKVDAARDARKSFIDYNITAPAINGLRNLPTPFLAYTYRVIPILAETAVVRPWKYVKYATLGYMLNNLGELLGKGDAEAERAAMTREKQGRVFGLPILPHRNIKLPSKDASTYIDITRYVPGGDIFDLNSGTIPLVPQPLQMNFGIAGDVLFPMLGFDLFRGDKIKGQGISEFDDFAVRAKFGLKRLIPNFPFVPGSYSTERIARARDDKSPLARNETELIALLNTLGVKIEEADIGRLRTIKGMEYRRRLKGIQDQIRAVYSKFSKGTINQEKRDKELAELNDKFKTLSNTYSKALNMEINYQEGAEISEIIPRIVGAVKEQTQKLFDKN